ncbi:MAG: class I SAM-dependent methyltransferase [Acidimicrobiales bacterium]
MTDDKKGPFESTSIPDAYRQYLQPAIFDPWARRLINYVGMAPGHHVLDVACGTGVVAHTAAELLDGGGRVVATDVSPAMLAQVSTVVASGSVPIEIVECSATDLDIRDASFDVVFCQQGLQFIPDKIMAGREMCRVLRSGGKAGVAVWATGARLEPFDRYADVLRDENVREPFPNAYDSEQFKMSAEELRQVLEAGGFVEVEVSTETLALAWSDPQSAALGITGTPYAPALLELDAQRQVEVLDALRASFTDADGSAVKTTMTAVLARAVAA